MSTSTLSAELADLLKTSQEKSAPLIESGDFVGVARHFVQFRSTVKRLKEAFSALENESQNLSYNVLPTMMGNADIKSAHIEGLGTVVINQRWSASMPDREGGLKWVRENEPSLIIETVAAPTLTAYAKELASDGKTLPEQFFKVTVAPYVSIKGE